MLRLIAVWAVLAVIAPAVAQDQSVPVRVVVWDEQQPRQSEAYENFLGNAIAEHLAAQPGLMVKSVRLDDEDQGLSEETLDQWDVIVWWGHVRQSEVTPETGRKIVERIKAGRLGLVVLHSAHWSTPFVQAMYERTRMNARERFPETDWREVEFEEVPPPRQYSVPAHGSLLTPAFYATKTSADSLHVRVDLPNCCFPDYRPDGAPSTITVLKPDHPLARGLPSTFQVPQTEMYNEPFHVPEPDEVIFEETWERGEHFRSGCVWNLGAGKVVYFRPGHETFPVYKNKYALQVVENAVRWLGRLKHAGE